MADVIIGAQLQLDANDGLNSMKQFKKEIKEAEGDLISMAAKFGENSKQAQEAAKKVAGLRDALGDAKSLSDAFNPDQKFRALSSSLNGVLGGFSALTGAMGLLGVESDQVQKQLLRVQSAMALSQGLNQVGDSIQAFKNLGSVVGDYVVKAFGSMKAAIASSGIGLLAIGLGILISKFIEARTASKAFTDAVNAGEKAVVDFKSGLFEVEQAMNLARKGVISKESALKTYNDKVSDAIGFADSFSEAENNLAVNTPVYIQALRLRTQAVELYRLAAEGEGRITTGQAGELTWWQKIGSAFNNIIGGNAGAALFAVDKFTKNTREAQDQVDALNKKGDDILKQALGFEAKIAHIKKRPIDKKSGTEEKPVDPLKRDSIATDPAVALEIQKNNFIVDSNRLKNEALISSDATRLGIEKANSEEAIRQADRERIAKIEFAQATGAALGELANLVGQQTAAGKILALTQIGIDTAVAIAGIVRQAAKNPLNLTGFAFAADIAVRTATIFAAINRAKNILKGAGNANQAGIGSGSVSAPLQAAPTVTNTRLDANQINQIGNAANPIRAFVVENDITTNQQRVRRLNRAARI